VDPLEDATAGVTRLFDEIAEEYDQSGVAFFAPIAEELVDLMDLALGERVVDVGCGRGAVTFPAARAVGPTGSVTAVDISPTMVEHTRQRAAELGYPQVNTAVVTGDGIGVPDESVDVVTSSLVLFFAPDPEVALRSWMRLLVPGGRIGIVTFGAPDSTWERVDDLFRPYLPAELLDARTTGASGPFATDEGVEDLLTGSGGTAVRTVRRSLHVHFRDAAQWRRFSMSTGQRAFWRFVPEGSRGPLYDQATQVLEEARTDGGDIVLLQDVRYTLGAVASPQSAGPEPADVRSKWGR
jgi:ubiquinone/menaquinone biosynthesis C-methylase UbiE